MAEGDTCDVQAENWLQPPNNKSVSGWTRPYSYLVIPAKCGAREPGSNFPSAWIRPYAVAMRRIVSRLEQVAFKRNRSDLMLRQAQHEDYLIPHPELVEG